MIRIKKTVRKLSNKQKIICLSILSFLIIVTAITLPSLAKYKNRSALVTASIWDGTIATHYQSGNGTINNPYIISSGSELAYLSSQLATTNYENTYFSLANDLILNPGVFNYNTQNQIEYILNSETYYVDKYTNKYYEDPSFEQEVGTINVLNPLNNFKGIIDGNLFTIYGLYLTDNNASELALFTSLEGTVTNISIKNAMIYGGNITAGVASKATASTLKNILFDGYVVGKENPNKTISVDIKNQEITAESEITSHLIDLTNNIPFSGSEIISTSLTGTCTLSNNYETSIIVNNTSITSGNFSINLGSNILSNISVLTSTTSETETITLSNLKYNITYQYGTSSGIVAESHNNTLENIVNKANVYGYSTSGGIIGVTTDQLSITHSYNMGTITSHYISGGLIGTIEKSSNDISITKSYNNGNSLSTSNSGLIGIITNSTGTVSINQSFNAMNIPSIGTISNTNVSITNTYHIYDNAPITNDPTNQQFTKTSISNLTDKTYLLHNLEFLEFVDSTNYNSNNQKVWIYENNSLPILMIDDINNPIATINTSSYSWNNYSDQLNSLNLSSSIIFNIQAANELRPIKNIYYYIHRSNSPLTYQALEQITTWTNYNQVVEINKEGQYIVYAKIVDYNNNITYLNTDLFNIDLNGIILDNDNWTKFKTNLNTVYISNPKTVYIQTSSYLENITSVKYYLASEILSTNNLDDLSEELWTTYQSGISINTIGKYIIYAKITDRNNNKIYLNTDYIIYNGYNQTNLILGRNTTEYEGNIPSITNKSTITIKTNYSNQEEQISNTTHNLISSILLPAGTKLTLIDNTTKKVYQYHINTNEDLYNYHNSCPENAANCLKKATYPLTLFQEIGTKSNVKTFTENSYYNNGTITESFDIIIDFLDTNIEANYHNVNIYMELHNQEGQIVRSTLNSAIKNFNIYSSVNNTNPNASLLLNTNYNGEPIIYNSNSTTNISINTGLEYKYLNNTKIIDTTYENQELGLAIQMIDHNGNTINREHLKNMIFKIGHNEYFPGNDHIIRLNLGSNLDLTTKTLTIITSKNNANLEDGTYYLKIQSYTSSNGDYYNSVSNNYILIPISVSSTKINYNYDFNVQMDPSNYILNKSNNPITIPFQIIQKSTLTNPSIKVSLYQKNSLTAYDQTYSLINLSSYVTNNLVEYRNYVYNAINNPLTYNNTRATINTFELNLITNNLASNGYKFVFDLYDQNKKIGTITKNIIIK